MEKTNQQYLPVSPKTGFTSNQSSSESGAKKICLVCGDKALGYNFNAITCESCKAFFRRNALKQKVFKCPFREQCEITVLSRRFCQKCRLRKCFEVGMLTDLIMTSHAGNSDDGNFNSQRLRKRRRHRDSTVSATLSDYSRDSQVSSFHMTSVNGDFTPHSVSPIITHGPGQYSLSTPDSTAIVQWHSKNPSEFYHNETSMVREYFDYDYDYEWPKLNCYPPHTNSTSTNEPGEAAYHSSTGQCEWMMETGDGNEGSNWEPMTNALCSLSVNNDQWRDQKDTTAPQQADEGWDQWTPTLVDFSSTLSAIKLFRLEELLSANEIMAIPAGGPPVSFADANLATHMGEVCIRLCIQMSKRIQAFRNLLPNDQITLLMESATELMSLRGVMVYQPHVESWRPVGFPHRYLPLKCLPTREGLVKLYSFFPDQWRTSEPIMLSLSAILLFDPNRPNLQDRESVRLQYQFYHDLLKDYLDAVHPNGSSIYARICKLLGAFKAATPRALAPANVILDMEDIEVLAVTYDWQGWQSRKGNREENGQKAQMTTRLVDE